MNAHSLGQLPRVDNADRVIDAGQQAVLGSDLGCRRHSGHSRGSMVGQGHRRDGRGSMLLASLVSQFAVERTHRACWSAA